MAPRHPRPESEAVWSKVLPGLELCAPWPVGLGVSTKTREEEGGYSPMTMALQSAGELDLSTTIWLRTGRSGLGGGLLG